MVRLYEYVGPAHVRAAAQSSEPGTPIRSLEDLTIWSHAHVAEREPVGTQATFVVMPDGCLRLASRRSEHVACAGGSAVLTAGEMIIASEPSIRVIAITNLSTGYCPEPESWASVAHALERAEIPHPPELTSAFTFRRCPACGERNLVKDDFFVCAICDGALPTTWNFA